MANGIDIDVGQSLLVGPQGPQGEIGPRGYGIKTIAKTGTDGLVDTYTVTFDDDRTATFEVTNGRAISSIDLTSTVENVDTYTITYNDGTTSTFTVTNSNVSREEFEEALELTNSEMTDGEAEGEKIKLKGVATTNLGITVQGNTYQETTTGKNLLEYTLISLKNINLQGTWSDNVYTFGDVTYTVNDDLTINVNAPSTHSNSYLIINNSLSLVSNTEYILNGCPDGGATNIYGVRLYTGTSHVDDIGEGRTFIYDTQNMVRINVSANIEVDNLIFKPMIRLSSVTDGTYEKFTYGASPNPDFPQEIQVVTGENEVQIKGKNLLPFTSQDFIETKNGVTFTGEKGVYSISGKVTSGSSAMTLRYDVINQYTIKQGDFLHLLNDVATGVVTFALTFSDGTNISPAIAPINRVYNLSESVGKTITKINLYANSQYDGAKITLKPMILNNINTYTDFEPYIGENYPLSLGTLELAKIGDYKDYIYKSGTEWFVHKEIGKVVLDGSETWTQAPSQQSVYYITSITNYRLSKNIPMCNYFVGKANVSSPTALVDLGNNNVAFISNTSAVRFYLNSSMFNSVSDLTTWLSTHNTIVYYVLATPTEEQITDTTLIQQLEALSQATAKGNNFIVTTETENLKPILKVQYKESTRYKANDLENRVEKLEEQIKHAGHVYGVRRKRENNSSSEWERTDDAIGLVANATHDGTEVQNDFDNLSPWKDIISFNLDLETGHKKAYYGDPDFAFDGSNGDVYTHIPDIYYRVWHDDEYDYVQIADFAESEFEKCDKFDIQRYKTGIVNDVLHSYSNVVAASDKRITDFRTMVHELGENYCLLDWRYFVIQLLYLVEYADYNSQAKLGNGFSNMRHNAADVSLLAEANTHRFVVNTNAGNAFAVGQIVSVGTERAKYDIAESRKIIAITDYDSGEITGKSITLDGAAFTTTTTSVIWSSAQRSGQCDSLGMKSGCLVNDSKHEVIYRGIEGLYGNIYQLVDGINIKDNQAYVCYDPEQYVSDKFEEPYEAIGYTNATTNGYTKSLGFDINNPLIQLPKSMGGANNTYITDYFYKSNGNVIARVGGGLSEGFFCGLWFWTMNNNSYSSNWASGARVIKYK